MMIRRRWFCRVAAALALSLLSALPARADSSREEAAAHFDRGLLHVDQREFSLAIEHFERAYELGRHFGVLYNLSLAYAAVGRYREASRALTAYEAQGGAHLNEERRSTVRSLTEQYEKKLAKLVITTLPTTAAVFIDGERSNAVSSVALDPGRHVIIARADGYSEASAIVELDAAERKTLTLTLLPLPALDSSQASEAAASPAPSAPRGNESRRLDRTPAYVVGGTALVLGTVAAGLFLHNNTRFDTWKRTEEELPPPGGALTDDQSQLRSAQNARRQSIETWDSVALGTGIAAGASLGVAAVLWFVGSRETASRVAPLVGLGAAGLRGTF